MNELLADTKAVLLALLAGIVTLLGGYVTIISWIGRRQIERIDTLERYSVSKPELAQFRETLRLERQEMHEENRWRLDTINEALKEIRDNSRATHERIDELYRDVIKR